jgi:CRP-like cAMP-binding protein
MPQTISPNHFLSSLSAQDRDSLQPHLKQLQLPQGTALYRADDIIPRVYFPYTGIISMIVGVSSGQYVEAGMLGRNGVIGAGAALDGPEALNGAIAQAESAG